MKTILFIILLLATNLLSFSQNTVINTNTMPAQTEPIRLKMPSIIAPNLYEL